MARVILWGSLKSATDGQTELDIDAPDMARVLQKLVDQHPNLKPQLDRGISIWIDGEVHRDPGYLPVGDDTEVYLLPRLTGG